VMACAKPVESRGDVRTRWLPQSLLLM